LWNLSAAYHTVRIDFLKELTAGLGMTFESVEKAIVLFTQSHKGLVVRMDHRAGCLRFGDAQLESDTMRSQLTVLAHQLDKVCSTLEPKQAITTPEDVSQLYQAIRENRSADHTKMLERKAWIESRKEEMERLAQEKIRKEQQQAAAEEAARKAEEERRIHREQQLREQEKVKKIQREMDNLKKQQLLQAMGHNTETLSQEEMAKMDTAKLQKEHQDKVNKKREEVDRKTREEAKRLDYLVRAIRIEELPLVKTKYDEKSKMDKEQYEQEVIEKAERAKLQWESDKKDKELLSGHSVFDYMQEFEDKVMEGRRLKHNVACREADQEAETQAEKDKFDRARTRKQEEERRIAEEEAEYKKEEENRIAEEERRKKDDARRERDAKEEEQRKAEAARMADEREKRGRQQEDRAPRPSRALDSAGGAGAGGGKYMPPSRRGQGGGSRFDDRGSGGDRSDDRGGGGGSRFGGDRGGYPGGGRYEGRSGGDGRGSGGGGYGDRDGGGGDRRAGDGGNTRDGGNSRWRK
jgi:translation initiation factor 3 subunit A